MSPNQFRIVVGSYEHNILCLSLDLTHETPVFTPIFHFQAHSLSVKCLAISKRYLVSGSNDEHIRIYDLQKRKELGTLLAHQGSITALRFSRGANRWLLSASDDHKIILWRVKDWENLGSLKGHTARINDIDIHPSGRLAISVSDDHSIRLWNLMTVKKAATLKLRAHSQNGQFVRWLGQNGEFFAVALLNSVLIYRSDGAKVHRELEFGNRKTVMHMEREEINGSEYLVVGLSDGSIQFFATEPLFSEDYDKSAVIKPEYLLQGHTSRVKDLAFYTNEHGTYLVSIGSDGKIIVWSISVDKQEEVAVYDCGERLNCLAVCDESIEKYESTKKRDSETAQIDEQSEVESDPEELRRVLFGKHKKNRKNKGRNKVQKVSVQME